MKTMKKIMMALAVMVMAVMVMPNTSAKAAKTKGKLNKKAVYLAINDGENDKISKETAKYTLKLTGVSKKSAKKVKWSSANKKIATVNKKGIVTGKKHGSTKITCKVGKTKYTCIVCVNDIQKIIKGTETAMYAGYTPTWITAPENKYNGWAESEGKPLQHGICTFGEKIKIHGHYYFFYYDEYKWCKKYAHIKEGRLFSKDINAKCNIDPEYKKAQAQKKEDAAKAKAEKEAKEKAEAEALAKAQAERQAQMEAERKAEIQARIQEREDIIKEAEAAGAIVNVYMADNGEGSINISYPDGMIEFHSFRISTDEEREAMEKTIVETEARNEALRQPIKQEIEDLLKEAEADGAVVTKRWFSDGYILNITYPDGREESYTYNSTIISALGLDYYWKD